MHKVFRPDLEPLTASRWCEQHYILSRESRSIHGPFEAVPYQAQLMDVMGMDGGPTRIALKKCSQVGYTLSLVGLLLYWLVHKHRLIAMYHTDNIKSRAFTKTTVRPALRDCQLTFNLWRELEDKRSGVTHSLMTFGGKTLRFLGAQTATNFLEFTCDVVVLDELDGYEVLPEGDPETLARRANTNSVFKRSVMGSTPTSETESLIHKLHERAGKQFDYYVPCPGCGAEIRLEWESLRFDKGDGSNTELDKQARARSARYVSPCCGVAWAHGDLTGALRSGAWRTEVGERIVCASDASPRLVDVNGDDMPWPELVGFHLWAAYSPWLRWEELVKEWLDAQGDAPKLQAFTNIRLGQPWSNKDSEVTASELSDRREDLRLLPDEARYLVMAVDVQDGWLSCLLVAFAPNREAFVLEQRRLDGETESAEGTAWQQLLELLDSGPRAQRETLAPLHISGVTVDSGYHTSTVYSIFPALRRRCDFCYVVKGTSSRKDAEDARANTKAVSPEGRSVPLSHVGTWQSKTFAMGRIRNPRMVHLHSGLSEETLKELSADKLVRRRHGRETRLEWARVSGQAAEAWDCLRYAFHLALKRNLVFSDDDYAAQTKRWAERDTRERAAARPLTEAGKRRPTRPRKRAGKRIRPAP